MKRRISFSDFKTFLSPCNEVHVCYISPATGKRWIANSKHFPCLMHVIRPTSYGKVKVKDLELLKRAVKEHAWQVLSKGLVFDF